MNSSKRRLLSTNRVEALNDGVFAIAMTLLAFGLQVPNISKNLIATEFPHVLLGLQNHLIDYAASFIILGTFWTNHHQQFHHIKYVDRWLLWMNILSLMFISLVPFTTTLSITYDDEKLPALFLDGNLLIIAILYLMNWLYATSNNRFVQSDLAPQIIAVIRGINLLFLGFIIGVTICTIFYPEWSNNILIFSPFLPGMHRKLRETLANQSQGPRP